MHGCVARADLGSVDIPHAPHMTLRIPSFIHSGTVSHNACLPVGDCNATLTRTYRAEHLMKGTYLIRGAGA